MARNKGYYASDVSECKYKYGGACWHAWMDGWHANESHLTQRAPDVMPCGHLLAESYQGEDGGTYCRICESA